MDGMRALSKRSKEAQAREPAPGKLAGAARRCAQIADKLRGLDAPVQAFSAATQPLMLATLRDQPFSGAGWLFEIKYDGVRVLAERRGKSVELYGRHQTVITHRYPELTAALKQLPCDRFIIDGEVIAYDDAGRPSFQRLQARMHLTRARDIEAAAVAVPVDAIFFDCLALQGYDLRQFPLIRRKEFLKDLLPPGRARYSDHVAETGQDVFDAASRMGLEGIIAKTASSRYSGGRSREWLKIKCHRRQEFVIGGYTAPQGGRTCFGALHLGAYRDGKLVYVSKVGTGFDGKTLQHVWEKLQRLKRSTSPFAERTPGGRGHCWVEPQLVCEVRFSDWTRDGGIRHPAFLGLRSDKKPEECRREEPE
jgi:bifunctional non-homologous end joining protein LigD